MRARVHPGPASTSKGSSGRGERVAGLEAGCHFPRDGPPLPAVEIPAQALSPFHDPRVLVANEAFGTKECWAEGSLVMAENACRRLGLAKPSWLPPDVYRKLLFNSTARPAEASRKRHMTDLMLNRLAAGGMANP